MVWGSDWPHPTEKYSKPNDAKLFDLLAVCAPEAASQHRIFVDNPATLMDLEPKRPDRELHLTATGTRRLPPGTGKTH